MPMPGKLILVVEDDPKDLELTLHAFRQISSSPTVITVKDGAEAMDFLLLKSQWMGREEGNPSVVLLDIKLPRLNGIQVLENIRNCENLRTVPVVMLSSSREFADLERCYELGANAYVIKPLNFEEYMRTIRGLGEFWGELNQPPVWGRSQPN